MDTQFKKERKATQFFFISRIYGSLNFNHDYCRISYSYWGFIAKSYQILKYISCFKKYIPY